MERLCKMMRTLLFTVLVGKFIIIILDKLMILYHSFSIGQYLSEVIIPCQDICLQDNVIYTCTGIGANLITWTVPNLMGGSEQLQILPHILYDTSGLFTAQFVSYQNNNIISSLSFTATTVLHNKKIVCDAGGSSKTCNIMIIGKMFIKILYILLLLLYTNR